MPNKPFRFIHAGDFHLEQPLMGVADVPDHLRNLFRDAPYLASQRVFDAAIAEDADFVILSGDILDPLHAGPHAIHFLTEQFTRLAERDIAVYWAGGVVDPPEVWPASIALPTNVHVFQRGRVEAMLAECDGAALARLLGISRDKQRAWKPNECSPDPSGLYTIAIAHGSVDPAVLSSRGIPYWALGGRHNRGTPSSGPSTVHYCGSPQGRCSQESGIHGCTLVQVDEERQTRTSLIPTDSIRWLTEQVSIDGISTRDDLESRLGERLQALVDSAVNRPILISWNLVGRSPLMTPLRRGTLAAELLGRLQSEYGHGQPAAWSLSLEVELADSVPLEWFEQETIRGDFLRAIRQLQMNPEASLDLEPYVAESHRAGTLAASVAIHDPSARDRILREAALLGIDLLSGEEAQP